MGTFTFSREDNVHYQQIILPVMLINDTEVSPILVKGVIIQKKKNNAKRFFLKKKGQQTWYGHLISIQNYL